MFATAWQTAEYVAEYAAAKGAKFYLIQHHEVFGGTQQRLEPRVNATWHLPLRKVVISQWLAEFGDEMGPAISDTYRMRLIIVYFG